MKKTKKIIALSVGASFLFALASCSSDALTSSNDKETTTVETTTNTSPSIETTTETITTTISTPKNTTNTPVEHVHDLIHEDYLAPECGVNGHDEYYYCESCGKYFDSENNEVSFDELTIPALDHSFGEVTYTWSSDNSTCTATRVCENCNYKEVETLDTKVTIKTPATCKNKGVKLYTAEFTKLAFEVQTKEEEIPSLDHTKGTQTIENMVLSTFDSEGSYDLVTYCSECGVELSRETITLPKEIRTKTSDFRDLYIDTVSGDFKIVKRKGEEFFNIKGYLGDSENVTVPSSITYEDVDFPVQGIIGFDNPIQGSTCKAKNVILPSSIKKLEAYAFKNVTTLETITLNEGLEFIGVWAFQNTSLKSIVMPSTLTKIDALAFKDVTTLEAVTLNQGLKYLGQSAFKNTSIKKITLPQTIEKIDEAAFWGCTSLEEVVFEDGITAIGEMMFFDCVNLKSVELPKTLTEIKPYAFCNCYSLEAIEIPEGMTSVGEYAFGDCTSLKEVSLPTTFKLVSPYAFRGCTSLEEIDIPLGVEKIGEYAFKGCTSLKNVSLHEGLITIDSYAFYNCSALTTIDIPSTVYTIGRSTFENASLLAFIPETVNSIGYDAFVNCPLVYTNAPQKKSGWSTMTKHSSVIYGVEKDDFVIFNDMVFAKPQEDGNAIFCTCLKDYETITIPSKALINGVEYPVTKVANLYFYENHTIKEVIIPDSVVSFEDYTFYRCDKLESIVLPDSVRELGRGFSTAAKSLKSISIPEGVTQIPRDCFDSCESLQEVYLPSTLKEIEDSFYGLYQIKTICIPKNVEYIDVSAFKYCYKLVEVYNLSDIELTDKYCLMANNIIYNTSLDVETQIKYDANGFLFVSDDNTCYLVDYIGNNEKIVLPNSVTVNSKTFNEYEIHLEAFRTLDFIKSITIPGSVKKIGDYAFINCPSLEEVNIEDGVEVLGEGVFYYCTSIKNIVLPDSIVEMGIGAFCECTSLESITVSDNIPVFGLNAFFNCVSLKNINFPSALTEIGKTAFYKCYQLSIVELPNQLTTIDETAFYECRSITSITIPASVRTIGARAFYGCHSLEEIIISEGVEEIGNHAFAKCKRLTSVTIPSTVKSIGESIFSDCYRLVEIYNLGVENSDLLTNNVIKIHTSKEEPSCVVIDPNGFIFGYDGEKGYLFGYKSYTKNVITLELPEYFIYNGEKITSYSIVTRAFSEPSVTINPDSGVYYCDESAVSLIIPSCVSDIAVDAFVDSEALYEIYNLSSCEIKYSSLTSHPYILVHTSLEEQSNIVVDENGYVFLVDESNSSDPVRLIRYIGNEHDLVLPNKVTYNGKVFNKYFVTRYAFSNNDSITSVRVPSNVDEMVRFSLALCGNLEYVLVSKDTLLCEDFLLSKENTPKVYYLGTYDDLKTNYVVIAELDVYYFTSNKEDENQTGKWWYFDTDSYTIIEKIVE